MSNATPTRLGQINATGGSYANDNALFLKVFSGEVLAAFAQQTVTMDKHTVRTITSGKSAQFPRTGRTTAAYHTPGNEIVGQVINQNERVITINDLLVTSVFLANIDEAKNHYDVRSIFSNEMGVALANQVDKHVLQMMLAAALVSSEDISTETDMIGTVLTNSSVSSTAAVDTNANDLIAAIFMAAQKLDEKKVPEEDRYVYVKPQQYYLLANSSKAINADFGNAGNGSTAGGKILEVAGIKVIKTNNLPTTNINSSPAQGDAAARQAVNATNTVALVSHKSAVGTVKLLDISTEMEYEIWRQGTLMVAKYAMGHDVLRPEAAVQIKTA